MTIDKIRTASGKTIHKSVIIEAIHQVMVTLGQDVKLEIQGLNSAVSEKDITIVLTVDSTIRKMELKEYLALSN